jgi:hypothetical protein
VLDLLVQLFSLLVNFWRDLPDPVKEKVMEESADAFDDIFRKYYRSEKAAS